jgi:hypothetical protein
VKVTPWNGEKIGEPGVLRGLPISVYHSDICAGPSISSSGLRAILNASPAHYWSDSPLNPERQERDASQALILGRGAHHLLLGESDFAKQFVIRPAKLNERDWNGNRADCKEWLKAVAEQGLTVLLPAQIEAIRGMALSLGQHPLVRAGILGGEIERSIIWQDGETGVWLKVRPDAIPSTDADFADLKTTTDVSFDAIVRAIGEFGYHVQGALVGMACRAVLGREMESFSLVFVEKTPPHCVRIATLMPEDLALGEQQIRIALKLFKRCFDTGVWPGPGGTQSDAEYIGLTTWARDRAQSRIATLAMEIEALS